MSRQKKLIVSALTIASANVAVMSGAHAADTEAKSAAQSGLQTASNDQPAPAVQPTVDPVTAPPAETQGNPIITVTASRVARAGFTAPTPTNVISSDTMQLRGQTNVSDVLLDLPELRASRQPATTSNTARGTTSSPDLRGLGDVRTLLLIDGVRATPAQLTGVSDLSLIPPMMIDRVEVVTGGASASWGSDAVAGVINLILKKHVNGLQAEASYNVTDEGDDQEYHLGLLGGTDFAGDRGHIVIGLDYVDNKGVGDNYNRSWGRLEYLAYNNACYGPQGTPVAASLNCPGNVANGYAQKVLSQHVVNLSGGSGTIGGLIVGVAGGASASLLRQTFNPDGSLTPYPTGSAQFTSATQTVLSALTPGTIYNGLDAPLLPPVERYSGMARGSYDVTDSVTFDVSALVSGFKGVSTLSSSGYGGAVGSGNITIRADNAYLPAAVAALMPAGSSFTLARRYEELGLAENRIDDSNYQFNAGLTGKFGGSWSWDVRAIYGENISKQHFPNQPRTGRSALSADAVVVTPANVGASGLAIGSIACRSTLTAPTNGCVPMDPFGADNISDDAFGYILSDAWNRRTMQQQQYVANLRGEPFSLWAGPVSLAVGVEHRREDARVVSDPISQVNGFAVGGVSQPELDAGYNVDEAYAETIIPLLKDMTFAKALDLNLAARHTDYSTSGAVNTWKVGVNYVPFDDLRFRLTRSRDIRAPNIAELFSPATPASSPGFVVDPRTGVAPLPPVGGTISYLTAGNPLLKPEIANTLTYGAVYQPSYVRGLSMSVDYTHIKVDGAIGLVAIQTILNQCFINNNPAACPLIVTGPNNTIVSVNSSYLNLSSLNFSSIDWETEYHFGLDNLFKGVPGQMYLSLMGSYNIHMTFNDGISKPVDRAGEVGGGAVSALGRPKVQMTGAVTYVGDRVTIGTVMKFISKGKLSNLDCDSSLTCTPPGGSSGFIVSQNHVPAFVYANLNLAYDVLRDGERKLQLFANIDNIADKAPPPTGGTQSNPNIYDVIGRTYRVGVRVRY